MAVKRYLDQEGLQVFWGLIKQYIDKKTEAITEIKPVYYKTDGSGNILYNYDAASGLAQEGVVYYERSGSGTDDDPFIYIETQDELIPGVNMVDGYFIRGTAKTTIDPTEDEKNYPVINPETGEQETEEVIVVDPTTIEMVNEVLESSAIPDESILYVISNIE